MKAVAFQRSRLSLVAVLTSAGYTEVVEIPEGAHNIRVYELKRSKHFLGRYPGQGCLIQTNPGFNILMSQSAANFEVKL